MMELELKARSLAPAAALLVSVAALGAATREPPGATSAPTSAALVQDSGRVRLQLAPTGNEARYRVNEQLARVNLPSDAVGTTTAVKGQLMLGAGGRFVADSSQITIDLASLTTDSDRRDNFVRRRTLEVEQYPTAVLAPRELRGLAWPLPTSGEHRFQLVGDLTLHGATKPTIWNVTATFAGSRITGSAQTSLKFGDYNMTVPRVAMVLSVQDSIRLEYDFTFQR
jgi:polyisoprenoid-binding protein YceI